MVSGIPLLLLIATSIALIVLLTSYYKLHPFLALILACFFLGITTGLSPLDIVAAIGSGFGGLMTKIALIIVFGSVIGVFLEKSGGTMKIARSIIGMTGDKNTSAAISVIGAIVSIPVFCDSGFILLSGLSEKLSKLSKASKASLSLSLATGLYTTHTLVPPTPGPIAAAGNIGASEYLGTVIILGICFSIPILFMTQYFSRKLAKRITEANILTPSDVDVTTENLPNGANALIPLLTPILLIASGTILNFYEINISWLKFISSPKVAVFLGAILAMVLLRPQNHKDINQWFSEAIKVSGPILIITGAGGAFGEVLKNTSLSAFVKTWINAGDSGSLLVLVIIFIIAAVLKSAQGSSTNAMLLTSSLLAPLIIDLGWDSSLQYSLAIMAIGGGAMTISHYNDSYFWVVSEFSGISAKDASRSFSLLTGLQGLTVLLLTLLCWLIFT